MTKERLQQIRRRIERIRNGEASTPVDEMMLDALLEYVDNLRAVMTDVLPYAIAAIGLPRSSWPSDSVILHAEALLHIPKGQ